MQETPRSEEDLPSHTPGRSRLFSIARATVIAGLIALGLFYLTLAIGGASFVHECNTIVCGQLHQAIFAAMGALALFVSAHRLFEGASSATKIVFLGTVPIFLVHVILVVTDPNESMFFPVSTSLAPVISGALLVYDVGLQRKHVSE